MYMVLTINPLYSSKSFFEDQEGAYDHVHKIIDISLEFFKKLPPEERSNYNAKRLEDMHELIKIIKFDKKMRKVFGKYAPILPPITNEEYAHICNKKNKARHLGKEV